MTMPDLLAHDSPAGRFRLWLFSAGAIALIALIDWRLEPNLSLGLLYLFPILVSALFLSRWQLLAVAAVCTSLREWLSPFPWDLDAIARSAMALVAFLGVGLFVGELSRNRERALEHGRQLEEQVRRRREAEEELRVLVESSPAAIVTVDAEGRILLANRAALRFLGSGREGLTGEPIGRYLPTLGSVVGGETLGTSALRTTLECIGHTASGERFLAHVWFSTSRTLFGAVSHEVRNLSAAAGVAYANLARAAALATNEDFQALGTLLEGLEKIASAELRLASETIRARANLFTVLEELRVVLEPALTETDTELEWRVPADLPAVCGEHHSLLQVFLNLAQNSRRELQRVKERRLTVTVDAAKDAVLVRFEDTGPGVQQPERLFQPFQHGSDATG